MQQTLRRIVLIYDARRAYDLKVMSGVASYLQENDHCSIYMEQNALKDQRLPNLHSWGGDGIIADFDDPTVAESVTKSRLPVVGFGSGYGWYAHRSSIPYFRTNNQAIASMAAEHLLERGLHHFAFCGYAYTPINGWSEEREQAFCKYIKSKGFATDIYRGRHKTTRQWASVQSSLGAWLVSLPKPLGIMAANDTRARHVLETCRAFRLRVPEEVAIIGVDNDDLLCRLSNPALSSIEQGAWRIGYEAAALLDGMMSGKKAARRHIVVDPHGLVTRRSTDVFAVDDPLVANAMTFIQRHAINGIKVPDVVNAVGVSRSGLETRFEKLLGYTVRDAIRQVKLERTRRLISETKLPLKQIAGTTGFKSIQHMTTVFGKAFGYSPAKYRRQVGP
jgi:LacI family transcriptional regulator